MKLQPELVYKKISLFYQDDPKFKLRNKLQFNWATLAILPK